MIFRVNDINICSLCSWINNSYVLNKQSQLESVIRYQSLSAARLIFFNNFKNYFEFGNQSLHEL